MKNRSLGHFITIVKKDLKVFSKDLLVYCLLTLVFPLCLGFFYGLMYQNIMEQEVKLSPLTLYYYSTTNDQTYKGLLQTFNSDAFAFVEAVEADSFDGFEELTANEATAGIIFEDTKITWINKGKDSIEKSTLQTFLQNAIKEINIANEQQNLVKTLSEAVDETKDNTFYQNMMQVNQSAYIQKTPALEIKSLSPMAFFILSTFVAFSLFITTNSLQEREKKLFLRSFATGPSRFTLYFSNAFSNFIISYLMCLVYFFVVFFLLLKMPVALGQLLLIVSLHALFISGFRAMITGFCRTDKGGTTLSIFVLMFMLFAGGASFPIESFGDPSLLTNLAPNYNLFKLYESMALNQAYTNLQWQVMTVLVLSLVMLFVGWVVFLKREEI
ncbi:MAG: ABC transporter permease [Thermotogota bacterium]